MVIAIVVMMCGSAMALPLDLGVNYKVELGELLVPGLITENCEIHQDLRISRPFAIGDLTLTPYIGGEMYSEEICDDLLLTVITTGVTLEINDNLTVGIEHANYDFENGVEDTKDLAFLEVTF